MPTNPYKKMEDAWDAQEETRKVCASSSSSSPCLQQHWHFRFAAVLWYKQASAALSQRLGMSPPVKLSASVW